MLDSMILGDLRIKAPRPDANSVHSLKYSPPPVPRHSRQAGHAGLGPFSMAFAPAHNLERAESHTSWGTVCSDDDCNTPCGEAVSRAVFAPEWTAAGNRQVVGGHALGVSAFATTEPTGRGDNSRNPFVLPPAIAIEPTREKPSSNEHRSLRICPDRLHHQAPSQLETLDEELGYTSADSVEGMEMLRASMGCMSTLPSPNSKPSHCMDAMLHPRGLLEPSPAADTPSRKVQRNLFESDGKLNRATPACPVSSRVALPDVPVPALQRSQEQPRQLASAGHSWSDSPHIMASPLPTHHQGQQACPTWGISNGIIAYQPAPLTF